MGEQVTVQNGYTFTTDTATGTVTARGELQAQAASRSHLNAEKAGILMSDGTQLGHLAPARNNGPTTAQNISAQHKDLNQSTVKKVENAENRLMSDEENPAKIQTERIAFSKNQRKDGKVQPDAYMFNDQITYADGTKDIVNLSFTNISKQQQEGLKAEMEAIPVPEMPNPGDTLRDRMDPKEYAKLMEATDRELPDIRTEFEKADTKKGKNEVQKMADRESFLKSIEVSPEVKAQLAKVGREHAAKDPSKGKKTSSDDGGRERTDGRDGRESGYKSGSKESGKASGKTSAAQDARTAATQGGKSTGNKGGKSGVAQGARTAAAQGGKASGSKGGKGASTSAGGKTGAAPGGRGGSAGGKGGVGGGKGGSGGGHGGGGHGGGCHGGGGHGGGGHGGGGHGGGGHGGGGHGGGHGGGGHGGGGHGGR